MTTEFDESSDKRTDARMRELLLEHDFTCVSEVYLKINGDMTYEVYRWDSGWIFIYRSSVGFQHKHFIQIRLRHDQLDVEDFQIYLGKLYRAYRELEF